MVFLDIVIWLWFVSVVFSWFRRLHYSEVRLFYFSNTYLYLLSNYIPITDEFLSRISLCEYFVKEVVVVVVVVYIWFWCPVLTVHYVVLWADFFKIPNNLNKPTLHFSHWIIIITRTASSYEREPSPPCDSDPAHRRAHRSWPQRMMGSGQKLGHRPTSESWYSLVNGKCTGSAKGWIGFVLLSHTHIDQ